MIFYDNGEWKRGTAQGPGPWAKAEQDVTPTSSKALDDPLLLLLP